jgi:hypothetical protein
MTPETTAPAADPETDAAQAPAAPPRRTRPAASARTSSGASAPGSAPGRKRGRARRKLRARKVDRIIRRVDPWSVLKVSFLFSLSLWIVFMLAGMILWTGAVGSGAIDNVEDFITDLFALESFAFEGGQLFRGAAVGGLIMVLVTTGFSVLMAVLFNLISDLTGGIRVAVVELENLRRPGDDL